MVMASRKGQGHCKGKKPTPKPPPKWQPVALSSLDEEETETDQQTILAHLTALEEAQGLSPSGLGVHSQEQAARHIPGLITEWLTLFLANRCRDFVS